MGSKSRHYLAPHQEVSESERIAAEEAAADADRRMADDDAVRAKEYGELLEEYDAELRTLLSPSTHRAFLDWRERSRAKLRETLEPPAGPELKEDEIRRWKRQRLEEFVREHEVDTARVRALQEAFSKRLDQLTGVESQGDLVKAEEVPEEIRTHRTNPWTLERPPYPGWQRGHEFWDRGFDIDLRGHVDSAAGEASATVFASDLFAGDNDSAYARQDAQIAFWYRPPAAGLVEVWVEGQCAIGQHGITFRDEWGWSFASLRQDNYLMIHPIHANVPGPSFRRMSWVRVRGDDDHNLTQEYLRRGRVYWAHLFSTGAVPAGQWIAIRCGTRSSTTIDTNDVTILSDMFFHWFIRSVQVRVTGE